MVDHAADDEVLALLRACRCARDRFIVIAMARAGLRRGEVAGTRREDVHFVLDASSLGCLVPKVCTFDAGTTPTAHGQSHANLVPSQ